MNWVLNALFWLLVMAVLFCGVYFLFFEMGTLLTANAPRARAWVRPGAAVLSLILTPAALGGMLLLFTGRRA